MNNTFSLNRFGLLLKKHYFENIRQYLMSLIVLIGVLILSFVYIIIMMTGGKQPPTQVQFGVFLTFFLLAGSIFTTGIFSNFAGKSKAIASLTLPASHLEKYLLGWFFTVVIFPIIYTSVFYLVNLGILRSFGDTGYSTQMVNVFEKQFRLVFLIYALFQSIGLCGAIYFQKFHFIKTAFLFFIIAFVLITLNTWTIELLISEDVRSAMFFNGVRFEQERHRYHINPSGADTYFNICAGFLIISFWLSAYFKIKEKQV